MIAPPIPKDELRQLRALRKLGLLDTPAEERFDRVVRTAARIFQAPVSLVSLVDANRQGFKARNGQNLLFTPRGVSFCSHALFCPGLFVVPDTTRDVRFAGNPFVTGAPHVRFYAGCPLSAADGSRVGVLCVIDSQPREFGEEDQRTLADLGAWAELELRALSLKEKRTSLEQQERFFDLSVDMLCLASTQGAFLRLSRAWTRTLGYPAEELRATTLLELAHEEDRDAVASQLAQAARGSQRLQFDFRCHCRDGSWRWLQCSTAVNPDEGVLYLVARDVTEQKQLEQERRRMEQLKDEFVSTVSHELRTPLTSIRGALSLLQGGVAGPLPEGMGEMISIAHKNSERLIRLINDILDLEKVEAGQLDFQLEPTELGALVTQASVAHQSYAAQYNVRVETELEAKGVQVLVDADRFTQVLANLLSNAIKFSPPGERVLVRLERVGGTVRICVEDRGPGIPESFRPQVFQRFAQAHGGGAHRKGGSGLGLSIARAMVEQQGGTLDFLTAEGVGTTFRVTLPEWPQLSAGARSRSAAGVLTAPVLASLSGRGKGSRR
jgi:PAS domain S-box-containing protein